MVRGFFRRTGSSVFCSVVETQPGSKSEAPAVIPTQLVVLVQVEVQRVSERDVCLGRNANQGFAGARICSN